MDELEQLPVLDEPAADLDRLVLAAKALSDPIRLRMLQVMALGRGCCGLPIDEAEGICVCEFEAQFGLGQSRASYHLRILREAGLVREQARGKWTYYALDREAARALLGRLAAWLQV